MTVPQEKDDICNRRQIAKVLIPKEVPHQKNEYYFFFFEKNRKQKTPACNHFGRDGTTVATLVWALLLSLKVRSCARVSMHTSANATTMEHKFTRVRTPRSQTPAAVANTSDDAICSNFGTPSDQILQLLSFLFHGASSSWCFFFLVVLLFGS